MACIPWSLATLASGIAGLWLLEFWSTPWLAMGLSAWVGFGFGACFVLYAAAIARHWGPDAVPRLYPLLFLLYGLSGIVGPIAGGGFFDWTGTYLAALAIAGGTVLLGLWATRPLARPVPPRHP